MKFPRGWSLYLLATQRSINPKLATENETKRYNLFLRSRARECESRRERMFFTKPTTESCMNIIKEKKKKKKKESLQGNFWSCFVEGRGYFISACLMLGFIPRRSSAPAVDSTRVAKITVITHKLQCPVNYHYSCICRSHQRSAVVPAPM